MRISRLTAALVLAGATAHSISAAQAPADLVRVGDAAMNGAPLQPYDNLWRVTVRRNDGSSEDLGLSSDHVRIRTIDGKPFLTRVEGSTNVDSKSRPLSSSFDMTFNVFDRQTMAPIHSEEYASDGSYMIRDFSGRHVVTVAAGERQAPPRRTEMDADQPMYDFHGGMTGLLLAALPLRVGYTATLPGMGDTASDLNLIRVVGRERIDAGRRGKFDCWAVEIGAAPSRSTYWISKQPPYVIRAAVKSPRGTAYWIMAD
jgi:hypothetical protein